MDLGFENTEDVATSEGEEFLEVDSEEDRVEASCSDGEETLELTELQPAAIQKIKRQFLAGMHESDNSSNDGNESDREHEESQREETFQSKDGVVWHKSAFANTRTKAHNIYKKPRTQIPNTESVSTPEDSFRLFLSEAIVEHIVECTNLEGKRRPTST